MEINHPNNQTKVIFIKEGNKQIFGDKIDFNYYESKFSFKDSEDISQSNTFRPISIEKIKYPKEWTVSSLQNFFIKASKETRELPLYAINAKNMNNIEDLRNSEDIYKQLLILYEKTSQNDVSFNADLIKSFNEQFERMTNNLIFSNIMFKEGVLPKKLKIFANKSELPIKQYIIYPELLKIKELYENQWNNNNYQLKENKDNNFNNNIEFEQNIEIEKNKNEDKKIDKEKPLSDYLIKFKKKEILNEKKKEPNNLDQNNNITYNINKQKF